MTSTIQLRDGNKAPWLAYGVGTALFSQDVSDIAKLAITRGFRHLDGAQNYKNEDTLGAAITESKVPRSDLFITTKLGPVDVEHGQTVEDTIRDSLKKLRVDYVDLFLVHQPKQHPDRLKEVWKEVVDLKAKGLAKSVGVSNFNISQLEEIASTGLEAPAVNQIEFHPFVYNGLKPLLEYQAKHGIVTASYGGLSPILPKRAADPALAPAVQKLKAILDKLAEARSTNGKEVTQNQILLKWLQHQNVIAITTSSKQTRIDEYLATESLPDLTQEELSELEATVAGVHARFFKLFSYMDD